MNKRVLPLTLLLLGLLGCSGKSAATDPAAAPAPATPETQSNELQTPSKYLTLNAEDGPVNILRGASYRSASDRYLLPSGLDVVFDPQSDQPLPSSAQLAHGVYVLRPDRAAQPQLHLGWSGAAPVTGACWIGLADFQLDRWRWHQWNPAQPLAVDLQVRNVSTAGEMPVAVLLRGNQAHKLRYVRVGQNTPPSIVLDIDHTDGPAPVTVTADGSLSSDPEGDIVKYEFDFNADGSFEASSSSPTAQWVQPQDGAHLARLRVTDSDGATAEFTGHYDTGFCKFWRLLDSHPGHGPPYHSSFSDVCPVADGGFYACGKNSVHNEWGGFILLCRYDAQGKLQWSRHYGTGLGPQGPVTFLEPILAPAPDNGIYMQGRSDVLTYGAIVPKAYVIRVSAAGDLLWERVWEDSGGDAIRTGGAPRPAIGVDSDAAGNVYIATAAAESTGEMASGERDFDLLLLRFNAAGSLTHARRCFAPGCQVPVALELDASGRVYVLADDDLGSENYHPIAPLLIQLSSLLQPQRQVRITQPGENLVSPQMSVHPDGRVGLTVSSHGAAVLNSDLSVRWSNSLSGNEDDITGLQSCGLAVDGTLWAVSRTYYHIPDPPPGEVPYTPSFQHSLLLPYAPDGTLGRVLNFGARLQGCSLQRLDFRADGTLLICGKSLGRDVTPEQRQAAQPGPSPVLFTPETSTGFADAPVPLLPGHGYPWAELTARDDATDSAMLLNIYLPPAGAGLTDDKIKQPKYGN